MSNLLGDDRAVKYATVDGEFPAQDTKLLASSNIWLWNGEDLLYGWSWLKNGCHQNQAKQWDSDPYVKVSVIT